MTTNNNKYEPFQVILYLPQLEAVLSELLRIIISPAFDWLAANERLLVGETTTILDGEQ